MTNLPIALKREPLVDAVFEVRLGGHPHMADILPGLLFGQLTPKPTIQRLPAAEIPQPIRASDPNFAFAPIIRLDWGKFTISFGDRNLIVGCKMPYPKWPSFKAVILDVVKKVSEVGIEGTVERYSLKYVNIIQAPNISEQINSINMSITVGEVNLTNDHASVQVHRNEENTLHILSVITGAHALLEDKITVFGVVVDIDSIRDVQFPNFGSFAEALDDNIETLRNANKIKFFSCLTAKTLQEMGPEYA